MFKIIFWLFIISLLFTFDFPHRYYTIKKRVNKIEEEEVNPDGRT